MKARVHEAGLTQRHLWRSTREAIAVQHALVVELSHDGLTGYGEASAFMTEHYHSALDEMHADLRRVAGLLASLTPDDPAAVWHRLAAELGHSPFLLAALDAAVHDLRARLLGQPLWQALGLAEPRGARSSFSIGLDTTETMVKKLLERPGWSAYKVKLADPGDLTVLRELRRHTDAPFLVDGNCGWRADRLVSALDELDALGVRLIEQPFPRAARAAARALKRRSPIPVIADESITSIADLPACAEEFHGINVKPMKAGGITPAVALLRAARDRGLITMLGCMPESAAGISATGHLAGLADHLDVDAVDLLDVDTGTGLRLDATGHVRLPDGAGTGYRPDPAAHGWRVRVAPAGGSPGGWQITALDRGRVVGGATLCPAGPPPAVRLGDAGGPAWRLHDLAVHPAARAGGAGTALLRAALTQAVLAGAGRVWCHAPTTTIGFLRRHGFRTADAASPAFLHWSPE